MGEPKESTAVGNTSEGSHTVRQAKSLVVSLDFTRGASSKADFVTSTSSPAFSAPGFQPLIPTPRLARGDTMFGSLLMSLPRTPSLLRHECQEVLSVEESDHPTSNSSQQRSGMSKFDCVVARMRQTQQQLGI